MGKKDDKTAAKTEPTAPTNPNNPNYNPNNEPKAEPEPPLATKTSDFNISPEQR